MNPTKDDIRECNIKITTIWKTVKLESGGKFTDAIVQLFNKHGKSIINNQHCIASAFSEHFLLLVEKNISFVMLIIIIIIIIIIIVMV